MRFAQAALLFLSLSAAGMVRASETAPAAKEADHPCKPIVTACEAAGFKKGAREEKKGLFADCLRPILGGQSVPGVTVSEADVAACKAKQGQHPHHRPPPAP